MATMNKLRSSMPTIIWILILAFVALIVFEWGMSYNGGSLFNQMGDLGTVNGEKIDRELYSTTINNYTTNYRQREGKDPDAGTTQAIEDQAWNDLVNLILIRQATRDLGLTVTTQEIYDWVTGDNPPPFLRQYFTDENGMFNRQALQEAIGNPQNSENWRQLDEPLRSQRLNDRYLNLVSAFAVISPAEVNAKVIGDNSRAEASYLFFNSALIADSLVTVTESDIKDFYEKNKEEFKKEETRKIRYTVFKMLPSREDSANIAAEVDRIQRDFMINTNDSAFVTRYSDAPYTSGWVSRGDMADSRNVLFDAAPGTVTTLQEPDGYHILKVQEKRLAEKPKFRARHILYKGTSKEEIADAMKKAADLKKKIAADRRPLETVFSEYARTESQDGSAPNGGDLGWFSEGAMVKPFEEAVQKARLNTLVGPVETQFGAHLILVTAKDQTEIRVADVFRPIKPQGKTVRAIQTFAEDFAFMAGEEGFEKEAETRKLEFADSPLIERRSVIPGLDYSSQLSSWMFRADKDDISEVITIGDNLVVAKLTEISPAGYQELDEQLSQSLRARVLREKKLEFVYNQATEVREGLTTDLAAATTRDPKLVVATTNEFTLNGIPSGVGRDGAFNGAAFGLKEGQISGAIRGERGAYIIRLNKLTPADPANLEGQQKRVADQLKNQRRNELSNGWSEALKKQADIKDSRADALGL